MPQQSTSFDPTLPGCMALGLDGSRCFWVGLRWFWIVVAVGLGGFVWFYMVLDFSEVVLGFSGLDPGGSRQFWSGSTRFSGCLMWFFMVLGLSRVVPL